MNRVRRKSLQKPLKTPPGLQELNERTRKLTRQAFVLVPVSSAAGLMYATAGMKEIAVICWSIAGFCLIGTALMHGLIAFNVWLYRSAERRKHNREQEQ